jgi:7-cyano-7-deazaguanine synthase
MAHRNGRECYSLSFDYGQRHRAELNAARGLAERYGDVVHRVVSLDLSAIGGSALTDMDIPVPTTPQEGIPITYVPARNTVFLSLALGWAEVLGASEIYIGVNAVDYSGYPDCRPEFIAAYQRLIGVATKAGVEGTSISLETPLIDLSKGAIIDVGLRLGVDYSMTVSCYQADEMGRACRECDSCRLRAAGFEQAGVPDPTRYR